MIKWCILWNANSFHSLIREWARTCFFIQMMMSVCTKRTLEFNLYSASSLTQRSIGRCAALLGHLHKGPWVDVLLYSGTFSWLCAKLSNYIAYIFYLKESTHFHVTLHNEFIQHWLTNNIPVVSNDAAIIILILHLSEEWMKITVWWKIWLINSQFPCEDSRNQ